MDSLPNGWTSHHDSSSGLIYYYQTSTGITQWTFPVAQTGSEIGITQNPPSTTEKMIIVPAQGPSSSATLNKDYLNMCKEYKQFKIYRDKSGIQPCVVCHAAPSTLVLFPCSHKCLCEPCVVKNRFRESGAITSAENDVGAWCFCPICNDEIKKILPHTGHEEDQYWAWVNEIRPVLPRGFQTRLKSSNPGHKRVGGTTATGSSSVCTIS